MAFSGGVFSRLYSWVTDFANNINITDTRMDAEMDGFATGLSNCVLKDGTQTITADIPMASHKFTGLSAGTATGHSVHYGQVATDTAVGLIEIATAAEASASSPSATLAITPATMPCALLASGTVSAQSTGIIPLTGTGYRWIDVRIDSYDCSVGGNCNIRYSTDDGSNYISTAIYQTAMNGYTSTSIDDSWGAVNATSWEVMIGVTTATDGAGHVILRIPTPSASVSRKMIRVESGFVGSAGLWAQHNGVLTAASNDDFTHLQIYNAAGGTVTFDYRVYGWR